MPNSISAREFNQAHKAAHHAGPPLLGLIQRVGVHESSRFFIFNDLLSEIFRIIAHDLSIIDEIFLRHRVSLSSSYLMLN